MTESTLFSTSPTEDRTQWFVWDIYQPLPPRPVFFGTMEDAGLVADALNARRGNGELKGDRNG